MDGCGKEGIQGAGLSKYLEKILKDSVLRLVEGELDPIQFAFQRNKGVDDAKLFILDTISKFLDTWKNLKTTSDFFLWSFPQLLTP